jgi:hypothetical protein
MRLPSLTPRLLYALALAFQCLLASAAPLEIGSSWSDLYLPDQHDKAVSLTANKLRVVLFAAERKPGDWAQDAIDKGRKELAVDGQLVLAFDVSRMPSLVTRMIALPNFRARSFPILVAREAWQVDFLPRKAGAVTVLTLYAGRITAIEFAGDEAALEQLLEQRLK